MPFHVRTRSSLIACLLLMTACSASGGAGRSAVGSTTSTAEGTVPEVTSTTSEEQTTTTDGSRGDVPSLEMLETLLPAASDLGPVWIEVDDTGEGDEGDDGNDLLEGLGDDCRVLERYEADPGTSVGRAYQDADGFEFELRFNRDVGELADEERLDRMIEDLLACEGEFVQEGVDISLHFSGGRRFDLGRLGVEFRGHASASYAGTQVDFTLYLFAARADNGVVVAVSTMDLLNDLGEVERVNSELFPGLIAEMIREVEAL